MRPSEGRRSRRVPGVHRGICQGEPGPAVDPRRWLVDDRLPGRDRRSDRPGPGGRGPPRLSRDSRRPYGMGELEGARGCGDRSVDVRSGRWTDRARRRGPSVRHAPGRRPVPRVTTPAAEHARRGRPGPPARAGGAARAGGHELAGCRRRAGVGGRLYHPGRPGRADGPRRRGARLGRHPRCRADR